jgi:hypothetical protein
MLLTLLAVFFVGCSQITDIYCDSQYADVYKTRIYRGDFSEIKSISDIHKWINARVQYKSDEGENVCSLEETLTSGYGDCEEIARIYLDVLYVRFGIKGDYCLVDFGDRKIEEGGFCNHAAIRYNGTLIEPKSGLQETYKISFSYTFDEIFYE